MAYVPGFDYDIFISYTHNDNHAPAGAPGWVDEFHGWLESWLVKRRGMSKLTIWRDRELRGNTAFDLAIQNKIKSSALFFALNSRNYLKSNYCRQELEWFHQYNSGRPGGLFVGEEIRIFNILLNNIPYQQWPQDLLGRTSGHPMFDARHEKELGDFLSPDDPRFDKQLRRIVDDVDAILTAFAVLQDSPAEPVGAPKKVQIFVAEVADTLQPQRKRLITDLRERGAFVFDNVSLGKAAEHDTDVRDILNQADLAVHMFDHLPGRPMVDDEDNTYSRRQIELTLQSKTPKLVWLPTEVTPAEIAKLADANYRLCLQNLENERHAGQNHEFVRSSATAFSEIVLQKLAQLQKASATNGETISFLVDTHQKDQRHAYKLADLLAEKGLEVEFNQESRDPTRSLTNFEQTLKQVRNLIIICGIVNPDWLHGRLKKTIKIVAEQVDREAGITLENIWIYLPPGCKTEPDLSKFPRLINIRTLDNRAFDRIEPHLLTPLLQQAGLGGVQ